MTDDFWEYLQRLVNTNPIVIDRLKGALHPRFPQHPYPVSYGYLSGTIASDAGGVDIWIGSLGKKRVVGALCSVDLLKKDTELKIVIDCTEDEINHILDFVNDGAMRAAYLKRNE